MEGRLVGRPLMSHRLSGDPGLRCLHPQPCESKCGKCLCNCDRYDGDSRGGFQGHWREAVANDPHGRIMDS